MPSTAEVQERSDVLVDPNPVIAVSKSFSAMDLAIRLAGLRVGLAALEAEPAELLRSLVAEHDVPAQVAAMYRDLADAHRRAVAREAEPTAQEAIDYQRYVRTVIRAVSTAR
ncbi:MAG: hypothetical protein IT204_20140 [Fimbriimonadaceae bacterium]|nr:hypothetical protein [Fimbriimonadaceae bacterium]